MKRIIDIDEDLFEKIKSDIIYLLCDNADLRILANATAKSKPLQEELVEMKAKIKELKPNNPNFKNFIGETRAINNVLEVIDNHIKELKGEQKHNEHY